MKKVVSSIFLIASIGLLITACKKNNVFVDKDVMAPGFAKFNTILSGDSIATYYIQSTNNVFKLPIGVTDVSTKDRTIQLTYSSKSAVSGQQYNAPATVVIPAGKAVDTLVLSGLFSGYPSSSKIDTLKITITGGDVAPSSYKANYYVYLRKYCDVSSALAGTYANSTDIYNGSASGKPNYTATISNWTPISATSASVVIKNMGATSDNGWGPFGPTDGSINPGLNATLDWSNPANLSVTIPLQNYFNDGSGNSTITATGTFSSCDQTFTIVCSVKYAGNGSTYKHTSVLKR